jgi:hypothetical protein
LAIAGGVAFVGLIFVLKLIPPGTPSPVDGPAYIRARLFDGQSCYLRRAEYCVTEPAFVDPIVGSAAPATDVEANRALEQIRHDYELALESPDGLARVERLVADRFAHPIVTEGPDALDVDLGVLPGELYWWRGHVWTHGPDYWKSADLAATLKRLAGEHPQATRIRMRVDVAPSDDHVEHLAYLWDRAMKVIFHDGIASGPVDLDALARGEGQLSWDSRPW